MIIRKTTTSKVRWELLAALGVVVSGAVVPAMAQDAQPEPQERNIRYTIDEQGRKVAVEGLNIPDSPAFARFADWLKKYAAAPAAQKAGMETEGVRLATERHKPMAEMIVRDPKHALELAIYPAQRVGLPATVLAQLEEFVQGRGTYRIFGSSAAEGQPTPMQRAQAARTRQAQQQAAPPSSPRKLSFNSQVYQVYTYGHRISLMTKSNLPFYGVALDGNLAMHENPLRILAKGEAPPADAVPGKDGALCPVCKKSTIGGVVGVLGKTLYYFDSQQHADEFIEQLWAREEVIGPNEHG